MLSLQICLLQIKYIEGQMVFFVSVFVYIPSAQQNPWMKEWISFMVLDPTCTHLYDHS